MPIISGPTQRIASIRFRAKRDFTLDDFLTFVQKLEVELNDDADTWQCMVQMCGLQLWRPSDDARCVFTCATVFAEGPDSERLGRAFCPIREPAAAAASESRTLVRQGEEVRVRFVDDRWSFQERVTIGYALQCMDWVEDVVAGC